MTRHRRRFAWIGPASYLGPALVVALAAACATAGSRETRTRVSALLSAYDGPDRPGACLLVRRRGDVVFERCVGMADLETGRPATPETNFRLASLTKQLTATAVLRLVQQGRLSLTTTLREVFPDFPPWADDVTVDRLLTHTAGLVDYEDLMPPGDAQILDAGVLDLLRVQDSTYFPPGSAFRYSNSAYAVLAQIVEARAGRPFADVLAREVFGPVGMEGTVAYEAGRSEVAHRAFGYSAGDDGTWTRTDQSPTSAVLGDGGVYSSLRDLNRWLTIVEGRDSLLGPALAGAVFLEARTNDGRGVGYGYGWFLDSVGGRARIRHEGSTIGFRNAVQRFPAEDLTVLLLSNRNDIAPGLVDSLVAVFLPSEAAAAGSPR